MKYLIILLCSITFSTVSAQSLKEMKNGAAIASIAMSENGKQTTVAQKYDSLIYVFYIQGFLNGIDASILVANKSRLPKPEDWMKNPEKSAPSFLAYIAKHVPKNANETEIKGPRLTGLVLCWYLDSHPKSNKVYSEQLRLAVTDSLKPVK